MTTATDAWERRGRRLTLAGHEVFVVDVDPVGPERAEPLLVIHGFPTSSFDFHQVVDGRARRYYVATARGRRELRSTTEQLEELAREVLGDPPP